MDEKEIKRIETIEKSIDDLQLNLFEELALVMQMIDEITEKTGADLEHTLDFVRRSIDGANEMYREETE